MKTFALAAVAATAPPLNSPLPTWHSSDTSLNSTSSTTPPRNSSSDSRSSRRLTSRSRPTTLRETPGLLDTTSSLTGTLTSTRSSLVTSQSSALPSTRTSPQLPSPQPTPTPSTGSPLVPLPQSRTRAHADHAGHSPPLVLLRVLTSSPAATSSPTLRCNSSTATTDSPRTLVATVDSWTRPSPTPRPTPSPPRRPTHTSPNTAPAPPPSSPVPPLRFPPSSMLRSTTLRPSRPSLSRDQSLSPLRLTSSPSSATRAVSSPDPSAEPTLTTVFSPLVSVPKTESTTSSSRTPGTLPGETTDTSRSDRSLTPQRVSAVSSPDHHPSQSLTERSFQYA